MACVFKSPKYQTVLEQSGIPEGIYNAVVNDFVNKHNRLPNLDEIPGSDSSQYIHNQLNLSDYNSIKIEDLLQATNTDSVESANVALNDEYSDLEVDVMPLSTSAVVDVKRRPSKCEIIEKEPVEVDENPNMSIVFNNIFDKLNRLYGIQYIPITCNDLTKPEWKDIAEVHTANAFIYNGNIYVNTDFAQADAPIHELTHLLLGSIRFKQPELYSSIVQTAEQFKSFPSVQRFNPNRAHSDILEETFVTEVSKYLAGMDSDVKALPDNVKYEINYHIKRLMDSIFMGSYSATTLSHPYSMSFKQLAKELNSSVLSNSFHGSISDAALHRQLANTREELIKSHKVEEICK